MLKAILYYVIGCLALLVINTTIQVIWRKKIATNWAYVNDMNSKDQTEWEQNFFPPIDGWFSTIVFCFVPLLNIFYIIFISIISLAKQDSNIIIAMQLVARETKREL